MKEYKQNLPEITLKFKKGDTMKVQIKSSSDSAEVFRRIWDVDSLNIYESMICIFLNRNNTTIGWMKISQGGLSRTVIDNRLILTTALNCLASGIILAHNHPTGNKQPSDADISLTTKLKNACSFLDINILDHIILTEESYYSFADEGLI